MDNYRFFCNTECEYFPCHKDTGDKFNCLFCYCPLYALGRKCGGECVYTERGDKSCADCTFPHRLENYEKVLARYKDALRPAIILIPGREGSLGIGKDNIQNAIKRAIGTDI